MMARIAVPACVLVVALTYGFVALRYPAMPLRRGLGPGFFPAIIAAAIAFLALIELARQVLAARLARGAPAGKGRADWSLIARELGCAAVLAVTTLVCVLAVRPLGFLAASTALITVLAVVMGTRSPWQALAAGICTSVSTYLVFAYGFGVVLAF